MILLVLLVVLIGSSVLGYLWLGHQASVVRIVVRPDTSDMPTLRAAETQSSYDPIFIKENITREIVVPVVKQPASNHNTFGGI